MRLFGYARVSTHKQSLDVQIKRLKEHGVREDRIETDMQTGKNIDRAGIDRLLIRVESGDKIIVTKLDRLGRNNLDMLQLIEKLTKKGVSVQFLDDGIATDGPMGKMVIQILSAVAEAERERILERSREGIAHAREKGIKFGRPTTTPTEKIVELHRQGKKTADIASELNISRASAFKVVKEYKEYGQLAE